MATRRTTAAALDPDPIEPPAPAPIELPAPDPDPAPPAQPFLIGPAPAVGTPGFYMGIGARAETAAEHATRLGDSAGTITDAGWLMGTLEPRPEWPASPPPPEPPEPPEP